MGLTTSRIQKGFIKAYRENPRALYFKLLDDMLLPDIAKGYGVSVKELKDYLTKKLQVLENES